MIKEKINKNKTAAVIIIGDEVLSGRTPDTNSAWIADRLTSFGITLSEIRVIPDQEPVIIETVNDLREKFDVVFTTGGIGPTHDDITTASVAKAFGVDVVKDKTASAILEDYYGPKEFNEVRARMALIPEGADLIPNPVSGAPGFVMGNVYVMAGVPRVMRAMFDHVMEGFEAQSPILSNSVSCALSESLVADHLETIQSRFPSVKVGSYPHYRGGILGLSLVLRSTEDEPLNLATRAVIDMVKNVYGVTPSAISISSSDKALETL